MVSHWAFLWGSLFLSSLLQHGIGDILSFFPYHQLEFILGFFFSNAVLFHVALCNLCHLYLLSFLSYFPLPFSYLSP